MISNQEYRNQNRYRQYPFLDDATLMAKEGAKLPNDFLLDAILYPIDLVNGLYLQSVDFSNRKLVLADTVSNVVHGVATWDPAEDTAYVYEPQAPERMVGVIVFGAGRNNQSAGGTLTFTPATAAFTPTAFYPLNQAGVRGIVLESGNYYTGDVRFEGRNGVSVRSYIDEQGRSIIEFNITGVNYDIEPCFECELVECLLIQVAPGGSYLVPAPCQPNTLCIDSVYELEDVCPPANVTLPSKRKDPCEEAQPCEDIAPVAGDEFYVCPTNGRLYIVAPSTGLHNNPLWIRSEEEPAPVPNYKQVTSPVGISIDERQRILDRMFDTAKLTRGRVILEYRGLTTDRHY
jgi:hypothetical protein